MDTVCTELGRGEGAFTQCTVNYPNMKDMEEGVAANCCACCHNEMEVDSVEVCEGDERRKEAAGEVRE
jgi:hypothetical protein